MCTRNASKNLSWFVRGHAGITSLCSAVQNYHRWTVHVQSLYWPAFLCFLQPSQRWDLRGKGSVYVAICLSSRLSEGDRECCNGLWSDCWIAPGWPVTLALHKFLLSRDGMLEDEGLLTFLLPAQPGKHKRIFFPLKNFWYLPLQEKYVTAFITSLDPKQVGFQLSQLELYEKFSFVLVLFLFLC